jgi:cytochrome oxidase Cu insertion factor (SCO1/SenC/PrrC family)
VVRWALFVAVPLVVVAAVSLGFVLTSGSPPSTASSAMPVSSAAAATWPARRLLAAGFTLRGEDGRPLSLAGFRGRPVLVTFIDPLCRDFCPIEAQRLSAAVRAETASRRPAIVAVSVNTAGDRPATLALDRRKWNVPPQWHWAIGDPSALARVWRQFHVQVIVTKKRIAGVRVQQVAHTEAAYLVDAQGYQRALFIWPYSSSAVTHELKALLAASSS